MTTVLKASKIAFTKDEREALERLRPDYHPDPEPFTPKELAHLRFLRWRLAARQQRPQ